jgi:class 3 adenylate cyclase
MEERLEEWVAWLRKTGWAVLVLDRSSTLIWISDEFKSFLHETDDRRLGVGKHIVAAMASEVWLSTLTAEGTLEVLTRALPFFLDEVPAGMPGFAQGLDEPFRAAIARLEPAPQPDLWAGRFEYDPGPGLPPYMVHYLVTRLRDASGSVVGSCMITQLGLRPTLLALLARGDERTYERMARLATPGRRQAAILFADLQHSGDLSRRMPTARYFELIQTLTAQFDAAVAANAGVVGKHAGDGWTAFFLVDDAGSPEQAVACALLTARQLQEALASLHREAADNAPPLCANVGLHWGANLYMGQLVPGGRLDVTALGDEVNECARIQETARDGSVFASKAFVELLPVEMGKQLGVSVDTLVYDPLGSIPGVSQKAVRDAGTLAVARL